MSRSGRFFIKAQGQRDFDRQMKARVAVEDRCTAREAAEHRVAVRERAWEDRGYVDDGYEND